MIFFPHWKHLYSAILDSLRPYVIPAVGRDSVRSAAELGLALAALPYPQRQPVDLLEAAVWALMLLLLLFLHRSKPKLDGGSVPCSKPLGCSVLLYHFFLWDGAARTFKELILSFEPGSSGPKPDRIDQATPQPQCS